MSAVTNGRSKEYRYGCALLSGGKGSRMGSVNKAELEFGGRSFSAMIASEMEQTGLPCYISTANYEQILPKGWKPVRDQVKSTNGEYIGPAGGIYSCLVQAEKDGLEGLFFAPCDAPFYRKELIDKLQGYIDSHTDAVCWETKDGKLQTTFGWYSVRCIPAFRSDIDRGLFKIKASLDNVRLKTVESEGSQEKCFTNINTEDEFRCLCKNTEITDFCTHLLISGKRQVGKTTLVEGLMSELRCPIYGYQTKSIFDEKKQINGVYMYPAGKCDGSMSESNHAGDAFRQVLNVNRAVFDELGTELIRSAEPGGIIVMDEIGFMETGAKEFCDEVLGALDGDIHIIATVKETDKAPEFLGKIRNHPKAKLLMLTRENYTEMYECCLSVIRGWEEQDGTLQA